MDWWGIVQTISDNLLSEAGILAFFEFWVILYLMWDNRGTRKQNRLLNDRVFNMGVQQVAANIEANNALEKMSEAVKILQAALSKEDRREEANECIRKTKDSY